MHTHDATILGDHDVRLQRRKQLKIAALVPVTVALAARREDLDHMGAGLSRSPVMDRAASCG
jgi:hypothetical protein